MTVAELKSKLEKMKDSDNLIIEMYTEKELKKLYGVPKAKMKQVCETVFLAVDIDELRNDIYDILNR